MCKAFRTLTAIAALALGGCVPRPLKSVSFLSDDLPFRQDPQDKDVMIYSHAQLKATSYSKFLIDPVKVFSNDSLSIRPEQEALLANAFREELISALRSGYEIVDRPGPGVLRVRIGIQDMQPAQLDFVEEGMVVLRLDTMLARVAMELDCLDSVSGERVVALIHTLHGPRYFESEKTTRLINVREAFAVWARSLRTRFDRAREKTGAAR